MKKILFPVAAMSIVALLVFNLNLNTQKDAANLLSLANMEALADDEGVVVIPCEYSLGDSCDFACIMGGVPKICTVKDAKSI